MDFKPSVDKISPQSTVQLWKIQLFKEMHYQHVLEYSGIWSILIDKLVCLVFAEWKASSLVLQVDNRGSLICLGQEAMLIDGQDQVFTVSINLTDHPGMQHSKSMKA